MYKPEVYLATDWCGATTGSIIRGLLGVFRRSNQEYSDSYVNNTGVWFGVLYKLGTACHVFYYD